jgi:hypothetical protein
VGSGIRVYMDDLTRDIGHNHCRCVKRVVGEYSMEQSRQKKATEKRQTSDDCIELPSQGREGGRGVGGGGGKASVQTCC